MYHPDSVNKSADQLAAEKQRALHAVHGGEVSEELQNAREKMQKERAIQIRQNALRAVLVRAETEKKNKEDPTQNKPAPAKKRKVNLKPAWEEGGHARKAFGG